MCPVCNLQYVGRPSNFRLRMNGHKSDFNLFKLNKLNKFDNKPLYEHLIHHNADSFIVQILDQVTKSQNNKQDILSVKERKWIWELNTIVPHGLNFDDGFYSQNRKYRKR